LSPKFITAHYFALRDFGFLITNIKMQLQKLTFFSYTPPFSFSIISLLFHISFIHLISLPSSFSISPRSLLSLSLISLHPFHMLNCLIAHSTPSFLSFDPIHQNLAIIFLSFTHSLPRYSGISSVILPVVSGFFDSFPSFLLVCVFVLFTHFYIHPSSFCSQSFHFTGIPVSLIIFLSLSPSSPCSFSFLSIIPSVSCTLPFHPFCLFFPGFTFNLFLLHSSLLAPISNFFLLCLYLLLFLPSSDFYPVHQYALDHALKHHHSPPEIISPLSLSPIPQTHSTTLFAFLTISLLCGSFIECN
jgi:hypothetical protein